jgi:hypothetical protein
LQQCENKKIAGEMENLIRDGLEKETQLDSESSYQSPFLITIMKHIVGAILFIIIDIGHNAIGGKQFAPPSLEGKTKCDKQ